MLIIDLAGEVFETIALKVSPTPAEPMKEQCHEFCELTLHSTNN